MPKIKLIVPERKILVKTSPADPVNLYYHPIKIVRNFFLDRISVTLSMLTKKYYQNLLEVGTGCGFALPTLAKLSSKVVAIDIHDKIKEVSKLTEQYKINKKISIKRYDVERLPSRNKSFDAVIGISVIEHLKKPEKALWEISRVLTGDGELVLGFPRKNFLADVSTFFLRVFKEHEKGAHKHFSETLIPMIAKYFEIKETKNIPEFLPKKLGFYTIVRCIQKFK